jgi:hypothetical protein
MVQALVSGDSEPWEAGIDPVHVTMRDALFSHPKGRNGTSVGSTPGPGKFAMTLHLFEG